MQNLETGQNKPGLVLLDIRDAAGSLPFLFHRPWLPVVQQVGVSRSIVPARPAAPGSPSIVWNKPCAPSIRQTPMVWHPGLERIRSYQWHSRELEIQARRILISLWSSNKAGWATQIDLVRQQLLQLVDKDRFLSVMDKARNIGVPIEHVCRGPLTEAPFKIAYQGSQWIIHPVEGWLEPIPWDAHFNKLLVEQTGIRFDTWHIAEELPKPSIRDLARAGSKVAAGALVTVAAGIAVALGVALTSLASLDPALVGTIASRAEPGQGDWFIIARWWH